MSLRHILMILIFSLFPFAAKAGTYTIPYDKPVATISVPDSWNPNSSDDGVDASSPDNKLFFSVYAAPDEDEKGALRIAARIASNGDVMKIDLDTVRERHVKFGKLATSEYQFDMVMENKPGVVTINLVPLNAGGFLQIIHWGSKQGIAKNGGAESKIFATIRLTGK